MEAEIMLVLEEPTTENLQATIGILAAIIEILEAITENPVAMPETLQATTETMLAETKGTMVKGLAIEIMETTERTRGLHHASNSLHLASNSLHPANNNLPLVSSQEEEADQTATPSDVPGPSYSRASTFVQDLLPECLPPASPGALRDVPETRLSRQNQ